VPILIIIIIIIIIIIRLMAEISGSNTRKAFNVFSVESAEKGISIFCLFVLNPIFICKL
jgi:hypothetical protein